ncbi:hypothetical protein [Micromonospora sp. NPDC005189]|uniref:hypothetical protein n=1 Tax=Micromonospora sp. NPDC005189 TaxID=3157019 RepID=UPI0033AE289A
MRVAWRNGTVVAPSDVVRVAPGERGAVQTVEAGIRAAAPGQTLLVAPGTYSEDLLFDRDVRLVADQGPGNVTVKW